MSDSEQLSKRIAKAAERGEFIQVKYAKGKDGKPVEGKFAYSTLSAGNIVDNLAKKQGLVYVINYRIAGPRDVVMNFLNKYGITDGDMVDINNINEPEVAANVATLAEEHKSLSNTIAADYARVSAYLDSIYDRGGLNDKVVATNTKKARGKGVSQQYKNIITLWKTPKYKDGKHVVYDISSDKEWVKKTVDKDNFIIPMYNGTIFPIAISLKSKRDKIAALREAINKIQAASAENLGEYLTFEGRDIKTGLPTNGAVRVGTPV